MLSAIRKTMRLAILGGISLSAAMQSAHALDIKLGHALAPDHSWHMAAEGFAKEVKQKTDGRVNFQIFPAAQLGNEKTVLEGLRIGSVGAAIMGTTALQSVDPRFGIVELPYSWSNANQAYKAYDGELGNALAKIAEQKGLILLGWWELGFRHYTNNKHPVKTIEDLKGLKTRVTPDKMRIETFKELGANPVPLAFGELYSALQQGLFDAQENPLSIIYTSSFYEVQKYLSMTGHVWGPANLILSKSVWNRISDKDKKIINDAAIEWGRHQRKAMSDGEASLIENLKAKGMEVNEVNKEGFMQAVNPVWERQASIYGEDLMKILVKYRESK